MKVLVAVQDENGVEPLAAAILRYPWPESVHFTVIHVIHPVLVNSYMSLLPSALTETIAEDRRNKGAKVVAGMVNLIKQSKKVAEVNELLIEGDAKSEIVEQIKELNADLVVLATHGKGGLAGSVSRSVISHCPCSAMIVPLGKREKKQTKEHKVHIIV